jgi:hypothetical protein
LPLYVRAFGDSEDEKEREPRSSTAKIEEVSSSSSETPPSSASISSSSEEQPSSSSIEEPPPSSSSYEAPSSSSSITRSSSGRGERSSTSKVDDYGNTYEDYPTLEAGAPGVKKGWATRYWDACKPHCSWLVHNFDVNNPKPWTGICKNCNKNNEEITTYERHPTWNPPWFTGFLSTPSACDSDDANAAYTCWDMAPIAINDTLAYGFAAMNPAIAECGSCYQLEFDGGWYDEPEQPRPTHRALQGKTLIVMASNVGADVMHNVTMKSGDIGTQFDIMIPGGGVGAFNALTKQIGVSVQDLGVGFGGLLSNCIQGKIGQMFPDVRDGSHRATLGQWRECLESECKRVFTGKAKELYDGCMWLSNWYMAADNPTLYYKKLDDCPKYLKDKYYSSINTEPPPLPDPYPNLCMMEGSADCKQTGWYPE